MGWRLLADALVVGHLAFIVFALFGGLLVAWRTWLVWLHLPAALWGVWIETSGSICPLTPWENQLRRLAGDAGYPGGFVEHYLIPVIYPAGLTPAIQIALAIVVVTVNAAIYSVILLRWRSTRLSR